MNRVGRQDRSALALVADYVNLRSVFLIQLQDSTHKGIKQNVRNLDGHVLPIIKNAESAKISEK